MTGADETAALHEPAVPGEEYDYGRAKSAAEAAVRAGLGDRAAIVRPGLIVGPGDPTDRFGYWVGRFALAGAEAVLAPILEGLSAQVIDVDDLAEFIVDRGAERWHGVANVIGDTIPLGELLQLAREIAGHTGDLVEADDDWLTAHEVAHWAGPRSLPLWLPRDMPGFATRSIAAYRAAGGRPGRSARRSSALSPTSASAVSTASGAPVSRAPTSSRCSRSSDRCIPQPRPHRREHMLSARRHLLAAEACALAESMCSRAGWERVADCPDLRMPRPGRYRRPMPSATQGLATLVPSLVPARRRLGGRRL